MLFKKICYPSTVFAANDLNIVETLNTELRMSARSQVLNFPPPKNLEPSKVQISLKNQHFKVLNYFTLPSVLEEGYLIEKGGLAKFQKCYKRGVIFL